MNKERVFVIGAGLYGCLTAYKIKKKFKNLDVILIDSSDHLLSSFDSIELKGKLYNNGFHGIELPRAKDLLFFFQNELRLKFDIRDNVRKLLISGVLVDSRDKLNDYLPEIKKFYRQPSADTFQNTRQFYNFISDDFKLILKKVSKRYSNSIRDVEHLLIPWFFPSNFTISSNDEGDQFRTLVKSNSILAKYAWPKKLLFKEIQEPFLNKIKEIGIKLYLNNIVSYNSYSISFGDSKKKNTINEKDKIFICSSPISILNKINPSLTLNLLKNPKILLNGIISVDCNNKNSYFSEILCCDENFPELARISNTKNILNRKKLQFQIELYVDINWNKSEIDNKVKNYLNEIMLKYGYTNCKLLDLKATRKVFFLKKKINNKALLEIKSWSKNFSNVYYLNNFQPINMAKTWKFSDKNVSILSS